MPATRARRSVDFDELYKKYENLIGYAANCYCRISPGVDVDDLYQDGCLLLMQTWTRDDIADEVREPLFKKSLFLGLRSRAYKQQHLTYQLVGASSPSDADQPQIDLDTIFATSDMQVLSKVFADEFVAELRRLIDDNTARLLDFLLDVKFEETGEIRKKGDWVPAAARRLDATVNEIYYWQYKLRAAATTLVEKFAA